MLRCAHLRKSNGPGFKSSSAETESCPLLSEQVKRLAGVVPVVIYGGAGAVAAVEAAVRRLAPGGESVTVDVWLRQGGQGVARKFEKRVLVVVYGPGDVERSKVPHPTSRIVQIAIVHFK
jgi:hypothetical protein